MDSKKSRLSKSVLQMKFMKRTRDQVEKEDEEEEGRALYSNEITDRMLHGNENITIEPSFVVCESLHPCGRFSYGGLNKDIERIMELEQQAKRIKTEKIDVQKRKEMKKDVGDAEMLAYYSSLVQTLGNKFTVHKKRQKPNVGPPGHFWKPRDD